MPDQIQRVALDRIDAHPQNPRVIVRRDVIDAITQQIRARGDFDPAHAILVRARGDRFEVISGHNRVTAAAEAGIAAVPAWVRDLDDEAAFMQLVLANNQSELSPLERGMHALGATEKGKHGNGIKAYAEAVGRPDQTVNREVCAARVASSSRWGNFADLTDRTRHLAEIHAAPAETWPALVAALVERDWTVAATKAVVAEIRTIAEAIPAEHSDWMSLTGLTAARLKDDGIHAQYVAYLASEVDRSDRAYRQAIDTLTAEIADFRQWLERQDRRDGAASLPEIEKLFGTLPSRDAVLAEFRHIDTDAVKRARTGCLAQLRKVSEAVHRMLKERRTSVEANRKRREDAERKARRIVSITAWKAMASDEREQVMLGAGGGTEQFNRQDGDLIDWAQWSWNPVTGCEHDCSYCYARDTTNRWVETFPNKFEPTLYPTRLAAPGNTKVPAKASEDIRYRNVFTGSMADLFGRWVPEEWIRAVLQAAGEAPQWNFLFLTKFPQRMAEFEIPQNCWMGTTVDCQARVANAEKAFGKLRDAGYGGVAWLSIEPMLTPLKFTRLELFKFIVIGGASASTKTPAWYPPLPWVADLEAQAREAGCRIYRKSNLFAPIQEMPWDKAMPAPDRAPECFHYPGRKKGEAE